MLPRPELPSLWTTAQARSSDKSKQSSTGTGATDQPLPAVPDEPQTRPYIEIRPTDTPLDPGTVAHGIDVLVTALQEASQDGLWHTLMDSVQQPHVEWVLVSDGRSDAQIRYFVGTDDNELLPDVKHVLRTALPNSYELREVTWHPRQIYEQLPVAATPEDCHPHPAITPARPYVAGVEYCGHAKRRSDWQAPLAPFEEIIDNSEAPQHHRNQNQRESRRVPLATLIETMREANVPVIYQAVCRSYDDWTGDRRSYLQTLRDDEDWLMDLISQRSQEEKRAYQPPPEDQARIDAIRTRDPARSLLLSARAVVLTRTDPPLADSIARELTSVFGHVGTQFHEVRGQLRTDDDLHPANRKPPGAQVFHDLVDRTVYPATYTGPRTRLPGVSTTSRGLVVCPPELPNFCLLGGQGLTPDGKRALGTRARERTGVALPPPDLLAHYTGPGMSLCMPLTHDRDPYGQPLSLPPAEQDRHIVVGGRTGAGKSILVETAMLTNVDATAGLDILIDSKGGGTAEEYLRAHYAQHGDLDDVLYFDCTEVLPALSFFDIRALLDADVPHSEAAARVAGQYEEILRGLMGADRYDRAVDAPKVIRNHVKALFDPIHGDETFGHDDLYASLRRTMEMEAPPTVTTDGLEEYFDNLVERDREVFQKVLGGAVGRVDTIATDERLASVFNHTPGEGDAAFDFGELLDEDRVVIFDFGGMEDRMKRTLTLVLLSNLWTALKARAEAADAAADLPLVNLYLEEGAEVAETEVMDTLLSQGRSFGLSVLLGVQFPEQLKSSDPTTETYLEALNEVATTVVGNVSVTDDLAGALATEDMDPEAVARRLSALQRGEWFVQPAAPFGEPRPRPFLAESLAPPPGHPASDQPLTASEGQAFENAFESACDRTRKTAGLAHIDAGAVPAPDTEEESTDPTTDPNATAAELTDPDIRRDSLLPHTQRRPDCIAYDADAHTLRCTSCDNRYDPTVDGMRDAIECCHSLVDVDRDDIPVCEINLKLSPEEIEASEWSVTQLLFLQAVYNAQQLRFDVLEYDIVRDSMVRLREYVGIEYDAVLELVDAGILRDHGKEPHKLYSLAPDGREVIGESYSRGVEFGHGAGDLEESAQHVLLVELLRRYFVDEFAEDSASAVEQVVPYYELQEGEAPAASFMGDGEDTAEVESVERRRLDVAGLDADGEVVVVGEAERLNNDSHEAIPADYDKMAACEPEEAIWATLTRTDAHEVLETLNDPADGEPRVEKTYSKNTPARDIRIDTPGATEIYPISYLRRLLGEE
ncbi:ATP-binding protein [Halorientalis persicus]|uniref:ATP-binding protein n=1 Tax=Halorientalis persicus TaxID=1367881 RepID=UPI001113E274|nr:ATP-binding protein [Halorientalis persicus]